ncbi:MAG: response regulator [Terrimonas sp.]|nr:response regulator [Terrimonas sp.]
METITILLADDHKLIRDAWTFMLNSDPRFEVCGIASTGKEVIELTKQLSPSVILMDINLGEISGFDAAEIILADNPGKKIIGVSMHSIPAYAKRLFKIGGKGYVTKNSSREEFIQAILEVNAGKKYICHEIKDALSQREFENEAGPDINALSKRELEVVKYIKGGLSSKEISCQLGLSLKTVEVHRYNILKKLQLKNSAVLINFLNMNGF